MGLIQNLATAANALRGKAPKDTEIGVAGESVITGFANEEANPDKLKPKDYVKMRQNDGTVAALVNVLTMPIIGNDFDFLADEDDQDEIQKKFVEDNLTRPPHKGGMSTPFRLVLADMTRGILEGFRVYEKVMTLNSDGKIVFRKIAPRDASTITIRRDANGGFDGFTQRTMYGDKYIDVVIPREKAFLYTFGKERNQLYGESAFKPAYYHYDKKHKLYYLANLAVQNGAIPPRILKKPEGASDEIKNAERAAAKLGVRQSISLPFGFDLEPYESSKGRVDPVPLIEHHNAEMARSVLAQFLMLGTSSKSVGSWALSENHSDIFIIALRGVMQSIEDHINHYLIPCLLDYNFPNPQYPEFKFKDMTDQTQEEVKAVFTEIVKTGGVPDWFQKGLVSKKAEQYNVDEPKGDEEEQDEEVDAEAPYGRAEDGRPLGKDGKVLDPDQLPELSEKKKHLAERRYWRRLTKAEEVVRFSELEKKFDSLEAKFQEEVEPIWQKIGEDAIERLTTIIENRDLKALEKFALRFGPEYRDLIAGNMKEAYEFGKTGAANELSVEAPATRRETTAFINQNAQMVVDKQMADGLFEIRALVLAELRKNTLDESVDLDLGDILGQVAGFFTDFFKSKIRLTGEIGVSQAVNRGREDVFGVARTKIRSYQYSAILDGRTCPICKDLDGSVVNYANYRKTKWVPPIHGRCRCIWVAILKEEMEPPKLVPLPKRPGGQAAPAL